MALKAMTTLLQPMAPIVRAMPKVADPFYLSPEWRALMRRIKKERGAHCEHCGAGGRIIGDHVVEIKDGGERLDPRNVRLMCMPCHNRKTAKARGKRARGGV